MKSDMLFNFRLLKVERPPNFIRVAFHLNLPFPFAGIAQFKFRGYILRLYFRMTTPKKDLLLDVVQSICHRKDIGF